MRFLVALLACLATGQAADLTGKIMCGYQGWFRTEGDGTNTGWHHYAKGKIFEPATCTIDVWPDVRELAPEDRTPTVFRHPDGSVAEVFSSVRPGVIQKHFEWMRDYGIDGAFLQRFAVTTRDPRFRAPMDQVLRHVCESAQNTQRSWVLMYDLTGLKPGQMEALITDWKRLQDEFRLTNAEANPAYLRHRGKPLVALWGLGFSDREPMLDEWEKLIRFLKDDPTYGGCSLMLGVPTYWRELHRDAIKDPRLHELIQLADVVSPWTVGRYNSPERAREFAQKTATADIAWCSARKLDYLPVAFPGFSWQNLSARRGEKAPLNAIPRLGGQFLWSQFHAFHQAGARMQYVAMFDEVDEATAIFKVRQDPPVGEAGFVSEPNVPGDHYLWLTGQAGRVLRGKADANETLPTRTK
jgi:hypothetical protein